MLANKENVLIHGPSHGPGKMNMKTPGPMKLNPKTPFKVMLNDDKLKIGKSDLFAGKDPSMFITPAGPRRALTGKTTNAKARLAPQSGGRDSAQKSLQKAGRGPRTSTTTETHPTQSSDGEFPEIEYMPPRELPLSDIPDGFQIPDYAKLSAHIYKDCHRSYLYDIDESGKSAIERAVEASDRQMAALLDAETEMMLGECKLKKATVVKKAAAAAAPATKSSAAGAGTKLKHTRSVTRTEKPLTRKRTVERPTSAASNNSINSRPSTAASIRAATALSQRPSSVASLSCPGTSNSQRPAHSRSSSTSVPKKPIFSRGTEPTRTSSRTGSRPNSRMAMANSKTTIGYTAGKEVARSLKKVLEVPKMETALEVCERVLREDEERQNAVPVLRLSSEEEEDEVDILKSLGPLLGGDEDDFFISLPELE